MDIPVKRLHLLATFFWSHKCVCEKKGNKSWWCWWLIMIIIFDTKKKTGLIPFVSRFAFCDIRPHRVVCYSWVGHNSVQSARMIWERKLNLLVSQSVSCHTAAPEGSSSRPSCSWLDTCNLFKPNLRYTLAYYSQFYFIMTIDFKLILLLCNFIFTEPTCDCDTSKHFYIMHLLSLLCGTLHHVFWEKKKNVYLLITSSWLS